jgi:ribose-phosphate pyrophosphokinase
MQNFTLKVDQDKYHLSEPTIFSGGEVHIDISAMPVTCSDYTLKARLQSNDDVMTMMLLADALYRRYPSANSTIEIPYMPYARQDRMCADGQHFGLSLFAKMLGLLKQDRIVTYDLHSHVAKDLIEYHGKKVLEITQTDIIASQKELRESLKNGWMQLVAPDHGAIKKTQNVAKTCDAKYVPAFGYKVRDPFTGALTGFGVDVKDFEGRDLLIVDDIMDNGGTFLGLAKVLKQRNAGTISLYVTHLIAPNGIQHFDGLINNIYTTDSFRGCADRLLNGAVNVISFKL